VAAIDDRECWGSFKTLEREAWLYEHEEKGGRKKETGTALGCLSDVVTVLMKKKVEQMRGSEQVQVKLVGGHHWLRH